jgi:hypothetical protein
MYSYAYNNSNTVEIHISQKVIPKNSTICYKICSGLNITKNYFRKYGITVSV